MTRATQPLSQAFLPEPDFPLLVNARITLTGPFYCHYSKAAAKNHQGPACAGTLLEIGANGYVPNAHHTYLRP